MEVNKLGADDLIGAVRYHCHWRLFAGTVAEWILDYSRYDPTYSSGCGDVSFRGGILVVSDDSAEAFCNAMAPFELHVADLKRFLCDAGASNWPLTVVVNFDELTFINGFPEIPMHEYVPIGWTGVEDCPLKYVSEEIRSIWQPKRNLRS